jgi:hypothetical protein
MLVRQVLYHFSCPPIPFCLVIFQAGARFLRSQHQKRKDKKKKTSPQGLAFMPGLADHHPPAAAGMTGMHHHAQLLLVEMGVSRNFCVSWPQTWIFLISTCRVARIISMSCLISSDLGS